MIKAKARQNRGCHSETGKIINCVVNGHAAMTGCGELPDTPAGLTLYPESGIDQESWELVPAREFFAG